jgi:hypothetical protein
MIANALPRPLTAGSVDNAILRADGAGGATLQNSNLVIDDVATATQDNVAIVNASSATNSALVLTPKGTGALIAGPKPDGTATGGNARGQRSVDLQILKYLNTQVTSGNNSTILGGYYNTCSGNLSIVGGNECSATNNNCFAVGETNNAQGISSAAFNSSSRATGTYSFAFGHRSIADKLSMVAHASGIFSTNGDAQRARFVLRNKTTTNAAAELFLDGSATRLTIPSGKIIALTINIAGVSSTGAAVAHYMRQYALKNVAATTSEVYAPITIGTDNAAGTSLSLTFNDPADALVVSVTGTASTIWRWVASVDAVEIAFGT